MSYEEFCASCTYIGEEPDTYGKYFCEPHGKRKYAFEEKCHRYCEATKRSNPTREKMYQNSVDHESSSTPLCYLTTTMCHILKYDDNNYYLETLRNFRDKTLKRNPKYIPLLKMYDFIGPEIANNLYQDPNKEIIANTIFKRYIAIAVEAINNEKTQEAVNIYIAMTHLLANRYNINTNIIYINPKTPVNTINNKNLGHAKTRKLDKSI